MRVLRLVKGGVLAAAIAATVTTVPTKSPVVSTQPTRLADGPGAYCDAPGTYESPYPTIRRGLGIYLGRTYTDGASPYGPLTALSMVPLPVGFVTPASRAGTTSPSPILSPYFDLIVPDNMQSVANSPAFLSWARYRYSSVNATTLRQDAISVFRWGNAGDLPVFGDWNGDGSVTIGIYRPSTATWYLTNNVDFSGGTPDVAFQYGNPGDVPVVGDWNCDGIDTPGVFRRGTWYLKNTNSTGNADGAVAFGNDGDVPVTGDWNGDGTTTLGVFRNGVWYMTNFLTSGPAQGAFRFGQKGDIPVVRLPK